MSIYDLDGNSIIAALNENIYISDIKNEYPLYEDDALLEEAVVRAKNNGKHSKIIWDGKPIHFNGQTHICTGFGGIDFNGSKIYMPNYDGGTILQIEPESSVSVSVPVADILSHKTTNNNLKGFVFTLGTSNVSSPSMSFGYHNADEQVGQHYCAPAIFATPEGRYSTGKLYLVPVDGETITCYNVHELPALPFEICNGEIITYNGNAMSLFVRCTRSNVRIHHFLLTGTSGVNTYHNGLFHFLRCIDLEIDNISGINPIQSSLASGYFMSFGNCSNIHIHDISVGDDGSWGAFGSANITNVSIERCFFNRWDCHYGQYGYLSIRDCVMGYITYGVGYGTIEIKNSTFTNHRYANNGVLPLVEARGEHVGLFDGDIIIDGCTINFGNQIPSKSCILYEMFTYGKTTASKVYNIKGRKRIIRNTFIPENVKYLFCFGTSVSDDTSMYDNVEYRVENSNVKCTDYVFCLASNNALSSRIGIKNCILNTPYIDSAKSNCEIMIDECMDDAQAIRTKGNTNKILVSNSKIMSVTADQTSSRLIMTGCVLSGTQSVSNFTEYALAGNIASDIASVNKHS